jgi:oxygen-independent coproporphyrinogen-3 oxidase
VIFQKGLEGNRAISLYFHIPFCTKKCPYCHFYVIPNTQAFHPLLAEGLEKEWELRRAQIEQKSISSIYFGGGTPTLFSPQKIAKILNLIPGVSADC